jgi:site-specific DNA-methyltransferase (adenine-specific)
MTDAHAVLAGATHALVTGDALALSAALPDQSVDCVVTSPPYWQMREYAVNDEHTLGNEATPQQYVANLVALFSALRPKLRAGGSVWLNLGDKYHNKNLMGMPWRVALALMDQGWIVRNDVIWDQMKGTQSPKDRLRDSYEHVFHLVRDKTYYYDADAILVKHRLQPKVTDSSTVSATGVSGVKYRKLIDASTLLSADEKVAAHAALDAVLAEIRAGEVVDFRMSIRGVQRAFHGEAKKISGRAKELADRGFYVIKSRAKGFLPSDIWRIVPEDIWRKDAHCAVFPEELLAVPIKATCPPGGVVLDPFSGTGSTVAAAVKMGRRGIGFDLSDEYTQLARRRLAGVTPLVT